MSARAHDLHRQRSGARFRALLQQPRALLLVTTALCVSTHGSVSQPGWVRRRLLSLKAACTGGRHD
eukprot:3569873-Prymnesium_polylepis.1